MTDGPTDGWTDKRSLNIGVSLKGRHNKLQGYKNLHILVKQKNSKSLNDLT